MGRKIGGKGLCDPLGMGSKREGRSQQVPCYRAGMGLGRLDLRSHRTGMGPLATCCPGRSILLVNRGCLLGLESWDKATDAGRKFSRGRSVGSTEDETGEQGRLL